MVSASTEAAEIARDGADTRRCADHTPGTMKWYGWGAEGQGFDPIGRPGLWPYAKSHLGISETLPRSTPVSAEQILLPPLRDSPCFMAAIETILAPAQWSRSHMDRLLHAYGKSTRDLWRMRHGRVSFTPDFVLFPDSEEQIVAILRAANQCDVVIVPFGGGSNVAGCLEVHWPDERPVASINLRRYNRVLVIDKISGTARVEAGILGPDLEQVLNAQGLTLGHVPDSFPYSTLGGWVATRSSGMFSDGYGNIEDMVLSLRMATPAGFVTTRNVPHASNGPDAKRLCIGSEGTLGIITEITVCVRELPQHREFRGYLFPTFEAGVEAMRECQRAGSMPVLSRLNDPDNTQLLSAFHRKVSWLQNALAFGFKSYLRSIHAVKFDSACLLIAAFEGDPRTLAWRRRRTERIYWRHGAIALGRGPGLSFADGKFDFPYIRDFLMDYNVLVDVSETSTVWRNIVPLYREAMKTYREFLGRGGRNKWVGCHLSHSYAAGASLYFSFAVTCQVGADGKIDPWTELEHFLTAKRAGLDCFAALGATLSHQRAVGYERLPWLVEESPVAGRTVVDTVKASLDPHGIMNPGKLVSGFSHEQLKIGPATTPARKVPAQRVDG